MTGSALLPAITAPEWLEGELSIQPLSGRELVNDDLGGYCDWRKKCQSI